MYNENLTHINILKDSIRIRIRKNNSYEYYKYTSSTWTTANIIYSNQSIGYGTKIGFVRNHGYNYDESTEVAESVNDIMKINTTTPVYNGAALNHEIITTLNVDDVIVRTKRNVNEHNGKIWDKVKLEDGTEGYVITQNLEEAKDYDNIEFDFNNKKYNVYFSTTNFGAKMEIAYPYYIITSDNKYINIIFMNKRMEMYGDHTSTGQIWKDSFKINLNINDHTRTCKILNYDETTTYTTILYSNQTLLNSENKRCFEKNHGYSYDSSKEPSEEIKKFVMFNSNTFIYSGAALNHDQIEVMEKGQVITIIKENINTHNGYTWDKVRLMDGTEGYIISQSDFTIPDDLVVLNINYNDKTYELGLSPSYYNFNVEDFPYYAVNFYNFDDRPDRFCVIFSKNRIDMRDENKFNIDYDNDADMRVTFINLNGTRGLGFAGAGSQKANFVLSNHNIYYKNTLIFEQNHGTHNPDDDNKTENWVAPSGNQYLKGEEKNISSDLRAQIAKDEAEAGTGLPEETEEGAVKHIATWEAFYASAYAVKPIQLSEASNNMIYYLTCGKEYSQDLTGSVFTYEEYPCTKGHTVKEFSARRALNTVPEFKESVASAADEMMDAAENLVTNFLQEEVVYASKEGAGSFPDFHLDWFAGVNNYRDRKSAKVTYLGGGMYTMRFTYTIVDYYDWEKLSLWQNFLDNSLSAYTLLWELNYYGYARNYTNYATVEYDIMWGKGDSINDATINIVE